MTDQQLNKMLVAKLLDAEKQIKVLKSQNEDLVRTHRALYQAAENAKGGLQVRRESMASVETLRDAVTGLLSIAEAWDATTDDGKAEAILFAKKCMFLTEGGSY